MITASISAALLDYDINEYKENKGVHFNVMTQLDPTYHPLPTVHMEKPIS